MGAYIFWAAGGKGHWWTSHSSQHDEYIYIYSKFIQLMYILKAFWMWGNAIDAGNKTKIPAFADIVTYTNILSSTHETFVQLTTHENLMVSQ